MDERTVKAQAIMDLLMMMGLSVNMYEMLQIMDVKALDEFTKTLLSLVNTSMELYNKKHGTKYPTVKKEEGPVAPHKRFEMN